MEVRDCCVKAEDKFILKDISFFLSDGDSMAIVGPSGCGKTTLGRMIAGKLQPSSGIFSVANDQSCQMVEQQDNFMAISRMASSYYGQRYENQGLDEAPTVRGYLLREAHSATEEVDSMMQLLEIAHLSESKLMQLSNGERKRTQLAAALLKKPDVLVLDQPFIGLDLTSRQKLECQINQLSETGKTIILICDQQHITEKIKWVLKLQNGQMQQWVLRSEFQPESDENEITGTADHFFADLHPSSEETFEYAVRMNQVNVHHNEKEILHNISWHVKRGERWTLMGHNGAGKTTLLSLITADNPQGYVNDLVLFDRKRGSGESIWDIKKRIGYVSPELHLYFLRGKGIFNTIPGLELSVRPGEGSLRCDDVISSGFHDQVGFSDTHADLQKKTVQTWFSILRLEHLAGQSFSDASLSEQRLLLLARALIKLPSLLILDEPCQGLDHRQTRHFTEMLDAICTHLNTTLIYVTHYAEEIPVCVTQKLELEHGRVKYCGLFHREA